jgi:hypothetical protein
MQPVAICLILQALVIVRGGYVPAMQVVNFLPWCSLAVLGAVEILRGSPELRPWFLRRQGADVEQPPTLHGPVVHGHDLAQLALSTSSTPRFPRPDGQRETGRPRLTPALVRTVAVLAVFGALAVNVAPRWGTQIAYMTTVESPPELTEATRWVADNVPRDEVLVVHDGIWTDLVHQYGFAKDNVIMAYKLDADPAVHERLTHLDYLIVPDWYYRIKDGKYPTLIEAQRHGVPAAHFGTGPDAVTVWHVSSRWKP